MVKKINSFLAKRRISDKERHIRWNIEKSPENMIMDSLSNRYHFVIVDDKNREIRARMIAEDLSKISPIISVRNVEGKVKDTRFRYLFVSYDSPASQETLNFSKLKKFLKRDYDLRERIKIGLNVEDYVANLYNS